jgi:N-acetylmuramic acid 6-phosphate etherase
LLPVPTITPFILAFDGGGTTTRAALYDGSGAIIAQATGAGSNPVMIGIGACVAQLLSLGRPLPDGRGASVGTIVAGLAGATPHAERIGANLLAAIPADRAVVSNDIWPVLFANARTDPAVLVIAGTGSSVAARRADGRFVLAGGRGPILGDEGSAYQIAVRALRAAGASLDGVSAPGALPAVLTKSVGLGEFHDLIEWAQQADRKSLAALAPEVTRLAESGDEAALECVRAEASALAKLVVATIRRNGLPSETPIYTMGGVFEHAPIFGWAFAESLRACSVMQPPVSAPVRGTRAMLDMARCDPPPPFAFVQTRSDGPIEIELIPTECVQIGLPPLDAQTALEIVRRMHDADQEAVAAVRPQLDRIARVIDRTAGAFRHGGRLIYAGAGTSGRLGVLDASECVATFGVPAAQVIALTAGGPSALTTSIEGAEDDKDAGAGALAGIEPMVGTRDVVVGVAASGMTPYVLAALAAARERRAYTALICSNPLATADVDELVVLETGPEVLPGSTRLKAGTAAKLVLNMISTGAMALSGRVFEGRMVGVRPTNAKLRHRALAILGALTGQSEDACQTLLRRSGGNVAAALVMARAGIDRAEAESRLEASRGSVREALRCGARGSPDTA